MGSLPKNFLEVDFLSDFRGGEVSPSPPRAPPRRPAPKYPRKPPGDGVCLKGLSMISDKEKRVRADEFLRSANRTRQQIERLQCLKDRLQVTVHSIQYDGVRGSGTSDPTADIAIRIQTIDKNINQLCLLESKQIEEINDAISILDNDNEKNSLCMRYLNGMSCEKIGFKRNYSRQAVSDHIQKGLLHLYEKKCPENDSKAE